MKSKQIDQSPKTFILVFKTGDELAKGLLEFAGQEKLSAASFKAVGALSSIRLGWYSWRTRSMSHRLRSINRWNFHRSSATSPRRTESRLFMHMS
jgi:hypothetical protein